MLDSNVKVAKKKLAELANEAGVSIATVSRVLNNSPYVSEGLRAKVQLILDKSDYTKKSRAVKNIISLIIPDISNPFFASLLSGVQKTASMYDYHLLVYEYDDNEIFINKYVKEIYNIGSNGIIIIPSHINMDSLHNFNKESEIPVVFLDRKIDSKDIYYVGTDNELGSYNATKYLLKLGHKKILYIAGHNKISTEQERYKGFADALKEYDIELDSHNFYILGEHSFEKSYVAVKNKIEEGIKFTAIFSSSDIMCFGARKALEESNIEIPNDVSLIGYDNIIISSAINLSTVSSPVYEMGRNAVLLLLDIINDRIKSPLEIILASNLIIRKSCKRTDT